METDALLELKGIGKKFSGIRVLNNIGIKIMPGKVYALAGENGAGKSTLCNIILGNLKPSEGTLITSQGEFDYFSLEQAKRMGIRMVHQELQMLPEMSIAENIFVGNEVQKNGWIKKKEMYQKTKQLLEMVALNAEPQILVRKMDIAARQLLEIARAISSDGKLIILDEPTSSLSSKEVEKLFKIIRRSKKNGIAFLFISHRLEEVMEIADEIIVLKDGSYVTTLLPNETSENEIIKNMVGRDYENFYDRKRECFGKELLRVEHLSAEPGKNKYTSAYEPQDINFSVSEGEVLGIAGLVGAGRTETLQLLFGSAVKNVDSKVFIDGKEAKIHGIKEAMSYGMAWITEDRKNEGLILDFSVQDNIVLSSLKMVCKNGFISKQKVEQISEKYRSRLKIKSTGNAQKVRYLSGGNQQKVVLGKWLATKPKILVLDEPTRGIDVGAKTEIYRLINQLTADGMAVILVSSELPEVMGMSDSIIVMHEGKITGRLEKAEFSEEKIMFYATGRKKENE